MSDKQRLHSTNDELYTITIKYVIRLVLIPLYHHYPTDSK